MTIDEIFQLEWWLEEGFKGYLSAATVSQKTTWYHSRESETAVSPRGELKIIMGPVVNHKHLFPDGQRWVFDAWSATLEVTVVTNRTTEKKSRAHPELLGLVRSRLQQFAIVPQWLKYQDTVLLVDIREAGTADSEDANNLDYTTIKWSLHFNINPEAWPPGL